MIGLGIGSESVMDGNDCDDVLGRRVTMTPCSAVLQPLTPFASGNVLWAHLSNKVRKYKKPPHHTARETIAAVWTPGGCTLHVPKSS